MNESVGVFVDGEFGIPCVGVGVVTTPDIAATTVGHCGDYAFGFSGGGADCSGETLREEAEIIGTDVGVAEVVHGKVRENGQWVAFRCSDGDEGEFGVLWACFAGNVLPFGASVHVGANRGVTERVFLDFVGTSNPLT